MDHFALADDELAEAQRNGTLHRNFQGYSTHSDSDLIAMGVSAISGMPGGFTQNHTKLEDYCRELEAPRLPVQRGVAISEEDRLRGEVIQRLICNNTLNMADVEREFAIEFGSHFRSELERMQGMERDGLISIGDQRLDVTAKGRLLIRNICKVFDHYRVENEQQFSKMI
jgi:oxygen-independent coproporphyrinogen-3 oxidase